MHPFIPFFTETVWSKNNYKKLAKTNLVLSKWPEYKTMSKFKKNQNDINNLIEFISNIRSSKSELKITPKLYCDIHFLEKSSKLNKIIQNNLILLNKLEELKYFKIKKKLIKIQLKSYFKMKKFL